MCFSIESIWTPKSKSNNWHQKPTLRHTDQGNFSRDQQNHLVCLFNIGHFSSVPIVLKWCRKGTQEDAGEERVSAKSKPMMSLVSRCIVKGSWRACLCCIRKPGENPLCKSNTSELVEWAALNNTKTRLGRFLIKPLRMEHCFFIMVFSRVEIWWSDGSKNGETWKWTTIQFVHTTHGQIWCWRWYGLYTSSQNQIYH